MTLRDLPSRSALRAWLPALLATEFPEARALGVTNRGLARATLNILSRAAVGQYRESDELLETVLRQPPGERMRSTDVANIDKPTARGRSIPLAEVATSDSP